MFWSGTHWIKWFLVQVSFPAKSHHQSLQSKEPDHSEIQSWNKYSPVRNIRLFPISTQKHRNYTWKWDFLSALSSTLSCKDTKEKKQELERYYSMNLSTYTCSCVVNSGGLNSSTHLDIMHPTCQLHVQPQDRFGLTAGTPITISTSDKHMCFVWVHTAQQGDKPCLHKELTSRSWALITSPNSLQAQVFKTGLSSKKSRASP